MEEALKALLLGSGDVTALSGDRINWGQHPQGQPWPAVVLTVISDVEDHTVEGPGGLSRARVQVDCDAVTFSEAKRLSRALRSLLDGYGDRPTGGLFQGVFLAGVRDSTGEAGKVRLFRSSLDFFVHYNRS